MVFFETFIFLWNSHSFAALVFKVGCVFYSGKLLVEAMDTLLTSSLNLFCCCCSEKAWTSQSHIFLIKSDSCPAPRKCTETSGFTATHLRHQHQQQTSGVWDTQCIHTKMDELQVNLWRHKRFTSCSPADGQQLMVCIAVVVFCFCLFNW